MVDRNKYKIVCAFNDLLTKDDWTDFVLYTQGYLGFTEIDHRLCYEDKLLMRQQLYAESMGW